MTNLGQSLELLQRAITDRPRRVPGISASDGLAVYRHAYRARLAECLEDDFPLTLAYLGKRAFSRHVSRFIASGPPRRGNINDLGAAFLTALARTSHGSAEYDLARIEWATVRAIHSRLEDGITSARLTAVRDWSAARLQPASSLNLIPGHHDLSGCWDGGFGVTRRAVTTIVIRHPDGILRRVVPASEGRLLRRLASGETLGQAVQKRPLPAQRLQALMTQVIADRLFTDVMEPMP